MLCSDDIIKIEDFDLGNNLLDEKSYENTLIYDVSYKTLIGPKPLRIRFDKIDEFIRVYNGTTYLVLFVPEIYAAIYNRIRYRMSQTTVLYMFSLVIAQEVKLIFTIYCL